MIVDLIKKVKIFYQEYGMASLAIVSVVFLLLLALFRIGKKGTYSKDRYYNLTDTTKEKRGPMRDSTGETTCRAHLEHRFKMKFDKIRPDFLKNPVTGGYNLELDCYNPKLRIAVEYNGSQHYKYIPYFHRNKDAFTNQKYRDEMKRVKCKENGVTLIEVPYTVPPERIPQFIDEELVKFGF